MYYNAYQLFDTELKKIDGAKSPLAYAKREFMKYYSPRQETNKWNFSREKTTKAMIADYKHELGKWAVAEFGGRKKAVEHFNEMKDSVSEKTFDNWKNNKQTPNN